MCNLIFPTCQKQWIQTIFFYFYGDIGHGVAIHIHTFIILKENWLELPEQTVIETTRSILEHNQTVHLVVQGLHDALLYHLWNFVWNDFNDAAALFAINIIIIGRGCSCCVVYWSRCPDDGDNWTAAVCSGISTHTNVV